MKPPTDKEIFNYMKPDEPEVCPECGFDEIEAIHYTCYTTYKCLSCGFEPSPPEE